MIVEYKIQTAKQFRTSRRRRRIAAAVLAVAVACIPSPARILYEHLAGSTTTTTVANLTPSAPATP